MAWHDSGTVSVTNGSSTVAGVGTDWLAGLRPGDALFLPDGWPYEVLNIASDTMLQLTRPYAGPTKSGERYTQLPSQGYIKLSADQLAALARQVGGIPTRVESLEGSQLSKGLNLSDLEDMKEARQNLGLKALAEKDASDLGLGAAAYKNIFDVQAVARGDVLAHDKDQVVLSPFWCETEGEQAVGEIVLTAPDRNIAGQIRALRIQQTHNYLRFSFNLVGQATRDVTIATNTAAVWGSGITTVDSNGFIKRASPVIDLYSDGIIIKEGHLETEGVFLVVIGVGHYELRNCPALAEGDGWYLEQPKDRNNNLYHTCDWVYDDVARVLTIKTYVPDYSSGRAENGAPVDIQEGRFISLRFQEDPSLFPELEPEPESEPDERNEFEEPAA